MREPTDQRGPAEEPIRELLASPVVEVAAARREILRHWQDAQPAWRVEPDEDLVRAATPTPTPRFRRTAG